MSLNSDGFWKPLFSILTTIILISVVVFGQALDPSIDLPEQANNGVAPKIFVVAPLFHEVITGKGVVIAGFKPSPLVTSAWFEIDGVKVADLLVGNNFSGEFDSTLFSDGEHFFSAHGCINSACEKKEFVINIENNPDQPVDDSGSVDANNSPPADDNGTTPPEDDGNSPPADDNGGTIDDNGTTPPVDDGGGGTGGEPVEPPIENEIPKIFVKGTSVNSALVIYDSIGNIIGSGTGAVEVLPGTYNLEVDFLETSLKKLEVYEASLTQDGFLFKVSDQIDPASVSPVNDLQDWTKLISIQRTITYSSAEVTGVSPSGINSAYYCDSWSSDSSTCLSQWTLMEGIIENTPFGVILNSPSVAIGFAKDKIQPLTVVGSNIPSTLFIDDAQGNRIAEGSGEVSVYPGTYNLSLQLTQGSIENLQANSAILDESETLFLLNDQIDLTKVQIPRPRLKWSSITAILPYVSFSDGDLSGTTPSGIMFAFYCPAWNATTGNCTSNWEQLPGIGNGNQSFSLSISSGNQAIGFATLSGPNLPPIDDLNDELPIPAPTNDTYDGEYVSVKASTAPAAINILDKYGETIISGMDFVDVPKGYHNIQLDFINSIFSHVNFTGMNLDHNGILTSVETNVNTQKIEKVYDDSSRELKKYGGVIPEGREKEFADVFTKPVNFIQINTIQYNYDFNTSSYVFNVPQGADTLWFCPTWDFSKGGTGDCAVDWQKVQDVPKEFREINVELSAKDFLQQGQISFQGGGGSGGFGFGGGGGLGPLGGPGPPATNELTVIMDTNVDDLNLNSGTLPGAIVKSGRLRHIQDTNFTPDNNYLLLAGAYVDMNTTTNNNSGAMRCNIKLGTDRRGRSGFNSAHDRNIVDDFNEIRIQTTPSSGRSAGWWYYAFTRWTATAGKSVDLNVATLSALVGQCRFRNAFLAAIDLTPLDQNVDYWYDDNRTVSTNIGAKITQADACRSFCDVNAAVKSQITFTPDGMSDYLVLGESLILLDSGTTTNLAQLDINYSTSFGAGSRLAYTAEGARGANDQILLSTMGVIQKPAATPLMVRVRVDGNGVHDSNLTNLFILRLNAFDRHDFNSKTTGWVGIRDDNGGGGRTDANKQLVAKLQLNEPGNALVFWSQDSNMSGGTTTGDFDRISLRVTNYVDSNIIMATPFSSQDLNGGQGISPHSIALSNAKPVGQTRAVTNFTALPILDGLSHDFNLAVDSNRQHQNNPRMDTNYATVLVFSAKLVDGNLDLNLTAPGSDDNTNIILNTNFRVDGNVTCRDENCTENSTVVDTNIQYCVGAGCTDYYDMNTVSTFPLYIVSGSQPQQDSSMDINQSYQPTWVVKATVAGTYELRLRSDGGGVDANTSLNGERTITISNADGNLFPVIYTPGWDDNATIRADKNFRVDGNTRCSANSCGLVDTNIQYCIGAGCSSYLDLNTDNTAPLYLESGSQPQSAILDVNQNYTQTWILQANVPNTYELRLRTDANVAEANTSIGGDRTIIVQDATAREEFVVAKVTSGGSGIDVNSAGRTEYIQLASIPDTNFNVGNDYLIIASSVHTVADMNNQITTVIGKGPADNNTLQFVNTKQIQAPPAPAPAGWQYTSFTRYTAVAGTDINYVMSCRVGGDGNWCGSGEIFLMSIPLVNLDRNSDYWYDENTTPLIPMSDAFASASGTTISFTADGASDYLILGQSRIINHNPPHSTLLTRMDLFETSQRAISMQGGSALTDTPLLSLMYVHEAPSAGSKTAKLRFRGGSVNDLNSSAMFILRLDAFDGHDKNSLTGPIGFTNMDQNLVSRNFATAGDRNVVMMYGLAYKHNFGTQTVQMLSFKANGDGNKWSETDQNMIVGYEHSADGNSDRKQAIGFNLMRIPTSAARDYYVSGVGNTDGTAGRYDLNFGYLAIFTTTKSGKLKGDINIPYSDNNSTINVDQNFLIQADVNCTRANCGSVDINLQYCVGSGCTTYSDINSDSNSPLYIVVPGSNPNTQTINQDVNAIASWILRASRAGDYELRIAMDGTTSDANQSTNGAHTITIQPTLDTMAFTLSLPSSGCTTGQGNFDGSGACQRAYFSGTGSQTQIAPQGQDASNPFFIYDNQSSVGNDMNIIIDINSALDSAITLKASQSSSGYEATCSGNPVSGCVSITGRRSSLATYPVEDLYLYKVGVPSTAETVRAVFMKFNLAGLPRKIIILNADLELFLLKVKTAAVFKVIFQHLDVNQGWTENDSAAALRVMHTDFSIVTEASGTGSCYLSTGDENCSITRVLQRSFEQGDVNFSFRMEDADNNGSNQDSVNDTNILRLGSTAVNGTQDINFGSRSITNVNQRPLLHILYGFGDFLGTAKYTANTQDLNIYLFSDYSSFTGPSDRNAISKGIVR